MAARRKWKKAATKAKAKRAPAPKRKRPDGSISAGIFDAVERLVASNGLNRSAAFRQLAKSSGRKVGAVSAGYYYAAKKRRGKGRPAAKKTAPKSTAKAVNASKAGGSISATIYEAIETLMAGSKMTRAAAFRQHAKQTGRKEGTVAVNYYYAARKRGVTGRKRRRRGRPRAAVSARRNGRPSNIEALLKSLTELIRAQESELAALRRDGARFAEVRRLIG
jgi:hypothetical protein